MRPKNTFSKVLRIIEKKKNARGQSLFFILITSDNYTSVIRAARVPPIERIFCSVNVYNRYYYAIPRCNDNNVRFNNTVARTCVRSKSRAICYGSKFVEWIFMAIPRAFVNAIIKTRRAHKERKMK